MFIEEENKSGLGRERIIGVLPINENLSWKEERRMRGKQKKRRKSKLSKAEL